MGPACHARFGALISVSSCMFTCCICVRQVNLRTNETVHGFTDTCMLHCRLCEDIDTVLQGGPITFDAVDSRLPYSHAVVKETLRLHPSVPKVTMCPCVRLGYCERVLRQSSLCTCVRACDGVLQSLRYVRCSFLGK